MEDHLNNDDQKLISGLQTNLLYPKVLWWVTTKPILAILNSFFLQSRFSRILAFICFLFKNISSKIERKPEVVSDHAHQPVHLQGELLSVILCSLKVVIENKCTLLFIVFEWILMSRYLGACSWMATVSHSELQSRPTLI